MFEIYHSNQPEHFFKNVLVDVLSNQSLSDPIQSEIIIVENRILVEWIQIELAKHFGIAANISFIDLASFIKKIFRKITSNSFVMNDFNHSIIYWKFMEILPKICLTENFSIIKKYLCNDLNKRKCGQLSEKLVELFTKYLIYRADWLDNWKSNKTMNNIIDSHQLWQSKLWRELLKSLKYDNTILYKNINYLTHCTHLLNNIKKLDITFFPKRIFIFGITSIPSIYWKILNLLSCHIDIYLWFISPFYKFNNNCVTNENLSNMKSLCKCYTKSSNILESCVSIDSNQIVNNSISINDNINDELDHIFLNFCGFIGKNTLSALSKLKNLLEKKFFTIPKEDSLLHILQKNILKFQKHIITNKNNIKTLKNHQRYVLKPEDQSITFHVCYSIQREVEVLHDNLLSMIQNDPLILQQGIIVMAPNICNYIAAIKTVFNNIYGRNLPFIISNDHTTYMHPIAEVFLKILDIKYSKCTFKEVFSFLKISLIARKFNIKEEEVKLLHQWTIESGIRWGLDDITMYDLDLPVNNQHTWHFGLTRMLLGYAIHDQYNTWEDISPYDGINEEYINIIGQLGEFLQVLKKWRNKFSHPRTVTEWMPCMQEILDDFFQYSNANIEESKIFSLLKKHWKNILESSVESRYFDTINIVVLRDKLYLKLSKSIINYRFLPNAINFCNITPICFIPCKVICFLGMNKDSFPRNEVPFDFDLMAKNPRSNDDNSLYDKDCYSFLLAFLLAREQIYISFVKISICDDTTNNSSILIDILFEYIAQYFYLIEDRYSDINVNIDHIRNHLYRWYNRVSFAVEHFISNSKIQSFANEWVSSINVGINTCNTFYSNFLTPLPKIVINTVSFYDLYNFYRHPIKIWFQKRLGVFFNKNMSTELNYNECFSMNAFHRFDLNTRLVHCLICNNDVGKFYNNVRASGILPDGVFGELHWIKQYSKMNVLANQIKMFYLSKNFNLDIYLTFGRVILTGQLTMIQENGLIRWKSTHLSIKDGLLLWLEHLVYCALGRTGDSRLFGIDDIWHFPNLRKSQAKEFLFLLISGYILGINTPLLLLYKSGGAWINQIFDWNTRSLSVTLTRQKKARYQLIRAWKGTKYSFVKGEYYDPYLRALIPYDLSEDNIKEIVRTAEYYFLFPMKYKI